MAWVAECPPRSFVTEELINPLESPDCDPKEQLALQGLCGTILKAFRDTPKSSHVVEATALSSIAAKDRECLQDANGSFCQCLINGTEEPQLLGAPAHVLWLSRAVLSMESKH